MFITLVKIIIYWKLTCFSGRCFVFPTCIATITVFQSVFAVSNNYLFGKALSSTTSHPLLSGYQEAAQLCWNIFFSVSLCIFSYVDQMISYENFTIRSHISNLWKLRLQNDNAYPNQEDVLLNNIEHKYICFDTNLVINAHI